MRLGVRLGVMLGVGVAVGVDFGAVGREGFGEAAWGGGNEVMTSLFSALFS